MYNYLDCLGLRAAGYSVPALRLGMLDRPIAVLKLMTKGVRTDL